MERRLEVSNVWATSQRPENEALHGSGSRASAPPGAGSQWSFGRPSSCLLMVEHSLDPIFCLDAQGRFTEVNPGRSD